MPFTSGVSTSLVNIATNDDERRIDLDILEERREQAAIREEKAKLKMKGYYDAKVPEWKDLRVTAALGKGANKLRDMDGPGVAPHVEYLQSQEMLSLGKCSLENGGNVRCTNTAKILPFALHRPYFLARLKAGPTKDFLQRNLPSQVQKGIKDVTRTEKIGTCIAPRPLGKVIRLALTPSRVGMH
ncbi:hypothetical protein Tco_1524741 [Tanacetum coccineum]